MYCFLKKNKKIHCTKNETTDTCFYQSTNCINLTFENSHNPFQCIQLPQVKVGTPHDKNGKKTKEHIQPIPVHRIYKVILSPIIFAVVEFCKAEPCLNGGTCKETALGYSCLCRSRFRGQNCDGKYTWCTETSQKKKKEIGCVLEEKTLGWFCL